MPPKKRTYQSFTIQVKQCVSFSYGFGVKFTNAIFNANFSKIFWCLFEFCEQNTSNNANGSFEIFFETSYKDSR